jgi:hypothetical protein
VHGRDDVRGRSQGAHARLTQVGSTAFGTAGRARCSSLKVKAIRSSLVGLGPNGPASISATPRVDHARFRLGTIWSVLPLSEESVVLELAAAVLSANRRKPKPSQDHFDRVAWALHEEDVHAVERALEWLLYGHGSDGVYVRTFSDDGAGQITIVGFNIWVDFQTRVLLEATFNLSPSGNAIDGFTVRVAGSRNDPDPEYQQPERAKAELRLIENPPSADDDWGVVLEYELTPEVHCLRS